MASEEGQAAPEPELVRWRVPLVLIALTFLSTMWVGAGMALGEDVEIEGYGELLSYFARHPDAFLAGWTFAVPLMAILFAHEMGHYVAGKIHRVDISPPYFIPVPFFLLGTMGAVIRMRGEIKTRNALLDIGAAGPLAGMVVAIPVLIWGLSISEVKPIPTEEGATFFVEGRNLLYLGLLHLLKGEIPAGQDIWLSPTAMAGWAGLLVTQINLIPVGQLDGGHVAYALFGKPQDRYSAILHRALPWVGVAVSLFYVVPALRAGTALGELWGEAMAGAHWVFWALILAVMARYAGDEHPPTGPEPLSASRKAVAVFTLVLFVLLFMPSWIYVPHA